MSNRFPDGMSVPTKALSYRMWAVAEARSWDMTLNEMSDQLGEPLGRVRRVAQICQWLTRFRTTTTDPANYLGIIEPYDAELEKLAVRA
ncbi:hypothetical protein [Paracoccus marcusii]|uniref:hypothetical protein n=1 Tax=Paracoccus marcusii TaxID=59779 RepID=UPI002492831C|nr:hypothetical protein [Paracoccus marcusii]